MGVTYGFLITTNNNIVVDKSSPKLRKQVVFDQIKHWSITKIYVDRSNAAFVKSLKIMLGKMNIMKSITGKKSIDWIIIIL